MAAVPTIILLRAKGCALAHFTKIVRAVSSACSLAGRT